MKHFTKTGEWVEETANGFRVGLTKDAVDDLGDVTFVELPAVGRNLTTDEVAGVLEAVKAATDLHAPVSGRVVAVNALVPADPSLLNRDPEGGGWLYCVELTSKQELSTLMTPEQRSLWEKTS